MAIARLSELAWSRHNLAGSGVTTEGRLSRATYPLIVVLHTAVIGGTVVFGRGRVRWPWLAVLIAVQPLRAWVLTTLGGRWNARAAVPDELRIETGGPYAYVRHPNYAIIFIELIALPLAFGVSWLAAAGTVGNAVLLAPRIIEEEAALMRRPAYRETMARRKRFIPGLF